MAKSYQEFSNRTRQRRRQRAVQRVSAIVVSVALVLGVSWVITWGIETIQNGSNTEVATSVLLPF